MKIETKKINDFVYREGQPQTHVYIVKNGALKVTTRLRGENQNSCLQASLAF
jgi:CRP-like cAMP-binding protein